MEDGHRCWIVSLKSRVQMLEEVDSFNVDRLGNR